MRFSTTLRDNLPDLPIMVVTGIPPKELDLNMKTHSTKQGMAAALAGERREGRTVGFVPTMGALHAGHLSLFRQARADNDVVVASVFVNPLQFGPTDDFARYPRDLEADAALAAEAGADHLFAPDVAAMYPRGSTATR